MGLRSLYPSLAWTFRFFSRALWETRVPQNRDPGTIEGRSVCSPSSRAASGSQLHQPPSPLPAPRFWCAGLWSRRGYTDRKFPAALRAALGGQGLPASSWLLSQAPYSRPGNCSVGQALIVLTAMTGQVLSPRHCCKHHRSTALQEIS